MTVIDAGLLIACSHGEIRLVVAVDVEYVPPGSAKIPGSNVRRTISRMTVDFWMLKESVPFKKLGGERLNVLHPTLLQDELPLEYRFCLRNDPSEDDDGGSPHSHSSNNGSSDNSNGGDSGSSDSDYLEESILCVVIVGSHSVSLLILVSISLALTNRPLPSR